MRKLGKVARVPRVLLLKCSPSRYRTHLTLLVRRQPSTFATITTYSPPMALPTDLGGPVSTGIHGKSFFEVIPRELRDAIYDLTFDHGTMSNSFEIEFRAPLPHLRLVSRQFKQEYDEQSPRDATLVISNHSLWFQHHACQTPRFPILPQLATRCTAMHFTHHLHDEEVFPNRKSLVDFLDKHYSGFPQSIGERLSHLEKVHVQPIFNYVQNFDLLCRRHQPESVFEYFLPWYDSATLAIPRATALLEPCHINLLLPNRIFPHLASRVKPKIASGGGASMI